MGDWICTLISKPPEGEVVMAKIENWQGSRNEQPLMRRGQLWFYPDGSMYVYYTPTHWRHQPSQPEGGEK